MYFFSYWETPLPLNQREQGRSNVECAFHEQHPLVVISKWNKKYPGTIFNLIWWKELTPNEWEPIKGSPPYSVNL